MIDHLVYTKYILRSLFLNAVIHCPELPLLYDGDWSTNDSSIMTEVYTLCHENYTITDEKDVWFNCTESGDWSLNVTGIQCKCEYHWEIFNLSAEHVIENCMTLSLYFKLNNCIRVK